MKRNATLFIATLLITWTSFSSAQAVQRAPKSFDEAIALCRIDFIRAQNNGIRLDDAMWDFANFDHVPHDSHVYIKASQLVELANNFLIEACAYGKFNPPKDNKQ